MFIKLVCGCWGEVRDAKVLASWSKKIQIFEQAMNLPEHLEVLADRAEFRPVGELSFPQMISRIKAAIEFAHAHQLRRLLVDVTGITGLKPPNVIERYEMIQECSAAAGGRVKVALVADPAFIDHKLFGVMVASNSGLIGNVFVNEADAVDWLNRVV